MADYRGTCSKCRHYEKKLHEEPCARCFRSMFHPCWEPGSSPSANSRSSRSAGIFAGEGAEMSPMGGYINMEVKDCTTCRWGKAASDSEPCSSCDGYEFDKWEPKFDKWEPKPEDDPETYVDQVLAEAEGREKTRGEMAGEALKRATEHYTEDASREVRAFMNTISGKPVYQQRIEERIEAQVAKGREKYGVTLEDNGTLTEAQRIEHLEEELIDGLMYCEHLAAVGRERGITADDYQRAALRTAQADRLSAEELLLNGVMGLCGEAGECIDIVKKARFQGHELNTEKLAEELGDVAWYLAVAAHGLGIPLSSILEGNVAKLMKRYPGGFDKARSMNRGGEGTEG